MRHGSASTSRSLAPPTSSRGDPPRFGRHLRSYGLVVPLVVLAGACGGRSDDSSPDPTPTSAVVITATTSAPEVTTATTARPTATTSRRPTLGEPATATIADGTHAVYLTGVDSARRTISVDVVQVLDPKTTGAASVCPEIARGDHDGYCVKNENGRLRIVPVAAEASLKVLNGSALRSVDMSGLAAARRGHKEDNFFQIVVSGGRVTAVKELFRA